MRPSVLPLALLALGGSEKESVPWKTSYAAALAEARARNVPVLLTFGQDH